MLLEQVGVRPVRPEWRLWPLELRVGLPSSQVEGTDAGLAMTELELPVAVPPWPSQVEETAADLGWPRLRWVTRSKAGLAEAPRA